MSDVDQATSATPASVPAEAAFGYVMRLWRLLISQRRNVQTLSTLVLINFLAMGLGFLTRVKVANTIGKADFGLFAYGFAIAAYGAAIVRFGLDRTLVRELIHFREHQSQTIAASLLLRGILVALVAAGLLAWKGLWGTSIDLTWGVILIALGQSMLGLELKAVYDSWGKMSLHAAYNLLQHAIYLGAIWAMIWLVPGRLSIYMLGIFMVASVGIYLGIQFFWVFRRIALTRAQLLDLKAAFRLARQNFVICISTFGGLTIAVFNQLILKAFFGRESLGGYAAAWQIAAISMVLFEQVGRIGNPATARVTTPGVSRRARIVFLVKYSLVMCTVACPITLVTTICPQRVLGLIYSPEYASAAGALRIMGIYMMVYAIGLVASQHVIALRKDKYYLGSIVTGGILSIMLCLVLIPRFQGVGAILALLISHSCCIIKYLAIILGDLRRR